MSNNGSNNRNDPSKERARQEATILQDFMITTQRRVERLRGDFTGGKRDALNLSEGEKKILNEIHNSGMVEGIIAGVATFVFLRRFPRYLEKVAARRAQQQQGNGFPPPPSSTPSNNGGYVLDQPGKINSPFSSNANQAGGAPPPGGGADPSGRRGGMIWRGIGLMVDTSLSLLVAAYTSFYMADREKISKSIVEIPLMEGRSAISDNFCPDLIQEYERQWNLDPNDTMSKGNDQPFGVKGANSRNQEPLAPFDRKEILKHPQELGILKGYLDFIGNCRKRQAMEKRIRQERGMGPNEQVEIPSPGVTEGELYENYNDFFDENNMNSDDQFSKEEASTFVSDQGDDSDNSRK